MVFGLRNRGRKKEENSVVHCIVISGFAGSGKSTVGKRIAKQLRYTYLDKDTLSRDFTERIILDNNSYAGDRESELYKSIINPIEYQMLIDTALENLLLHNSVVISAPFIAQLQMDNWFEDNIMRAIPSGAKLSLVWIETDEDTERIRLIDRGAMRDNWKLENWEQYCKFHRTFEPKIDKEQLYIFSNDNQTNESFNERIEDLIKWLNR